MFGIGATEILIVAGVVVLLFGATKIPTLMRSLGSGVTEFKKGIREGEREGEREREREREEETEALSSKP